jgi:hypothetical protein
VATDAGSNTRGSYLVFAEDVSDDVGDVVEFHDLAVNNRVSLEVFEAEIEERETGALATQFNRFHRTRTDIETDEILFSGGFFEHG